MNAEMSAKLAAFIAALTMNGLIIASIAYMFQVPVEQRTRWSMPPASLTLANGSTNAHQAGPTIADPNRHRDSRHRS